MLASLLPVSAFADAANVGQTPSAARASNTSRVIVSINGIDNPKFGQKLDYDISITTDPAGAVITEGENAPIYEWYAFNDYTGEYYLVTDPDYVCDARAYKLKVITHHTEAYRSSRNEYLWDGNLIEGSPLTGETDDGGNYIVLSYPMHHKYTVSTVSYTDMPYTYRVGDKVANFTPATLKGDGKTCEYFWYIAKLNGDGDTVAMYVSKDQEATMLKSMPDLTASDLAAARKSFGTTFEKGYYYILFNFQIIPVTYQYDFHVTVNVTYRNGQTASTLLYGQPDGEDGYPEAVSTSFIAVALSATPTLKVTTSAGKPKLSWDAVAGAEKYIVYRSTDGKKYKQYTSTTKTSYTNTSAKIGTTYYYKIKAVDANGTMSDYSNVKSIKCTPAAPVVSISRSSGKPKLSWKAVNGATKYYIYRSTDGKNYKQYTTTTKTSYTNTDVKVGTKYYYKVKAVAVVNNKNVFSAYSTAKSLLVTTAAPSVKITTSGGKPKISWNKVDGATKYYIYRSTDGKNFSYQYSTTRLDYTNKAAKKNTKYYYKVKSVKVVNGKDVTSAFSKAVSIKATK